MRNQQFDVVVIDEAGQSTEPDCWIALLKARKVILVKKKEKKKKKELHC
jgi:superfamily I DNA and/or RNA helicase